MTIDRIQAAPPGGAPGGGCSRLVLLAVLVLCGGVAAGQGTRFAGDLSPAGGLVWPQEQPLRQEICLNGRWEFQPVSLPAHWVEGQGVPPELPLPAPGAWERVKIKIPSPWNVNDWGGGSRVGKGTGLPYAPSSVYYPSYPSHWEKARMGWLKRSFTLPAGWEHKRILLHFEAVAGECRVVVNGQTVGRHFDSYLPFTVDITDYIRKKGDNELLVGIRHRRLFDKKHPHYPYFSATYPSGSNTDDLAGIWQDVFLQAVPQARITSVFVRPDVAADELALDVTLLNPDTQPRSFQLGGVVRPWINKALEGGRPTAEIDWALGEVVLQVAPLDVTLPGGSSRTVTLKTTVDRRLKLWSPAAPHLYTVLLDVSSGGRTLDRKAERFGWRSFTIQGKDFYLNGEKVQLFGDLQHPFGPYICSRRFAWAWYRMIQDVGGNAVRPHAQPWPRVYYDLADEMGLMVLDETALFGSSIRLNMEEESLWQRAADHLDQLVLRDRNHPSVVGWSIGNELFAIALLNKPPAEVARRWDARIIELARRPALLDPTRPFITSDGDRDMEGHLPVWSKHFGHGLPLEQLPQVHKPLVVGESGATYYGKPAELFPFVGLKAYQSYYGRNEALAIDVYQNAVKMAREHLDWYSPSELCWFGLEHLNLGYSDATRLPDLRDGIFPGLPYREGKPGYQFERIPPYVTTFNPGLDPSLPLYKPLPMFYALKAALAREGPRPSAWDHFQDTLLNLQRPLPAPTTAGVYVAGSREGALSRLLDSAGIARSADGEEAKVVLIDGAHITEEQWQKAVPVVHSVRQKGGNICILVAGQPPRDFLQALLPGKVTLVERPSTALRSHGGTAIGPYFDLRSLYFSEMKGDRLVLKKALGEEVAAGSTVVLEAAPTDWSLFNGVPENRKCAQVVLYEYLQKPRGIALVEYPLDKALVQLSAIDYTILTPEMMAFWRRLFASLGVRTAPADAQKKGAGRRPHDLLLDGPVNQ